MTFAGALRRARRVAVRVKRRGLRVWEDRLDRERPRVPLRPEPDPSFDGVRGRVLVTDCGDGAYVRMLVDRSVDAYGVGTNVDANVEGQRAGLDLRTDRTRAAVAAVADGALAGIVLNGCSRRTESDALRALAPDGILVRART